MDFDPKTRPSLLRDLLDTSYTLDETLERALSYAGWLEERASVVVFVWFSPPCETYSPITIGTQSAPSKGGPMRKGREQAYRPVCGARGREARSADRLVLRVLGWLHKLAKKVRV